MGDGPTRYRFGPLERRGLIAGWRSGQILSVAAMLVVAVAILRRLPDAPGAFCALLLVALGVGFACWPIGGRTGEEWLPTVVRWTRRNLRDRSAPPAADRGARRAGGGNRSRPPDPLFDGVWLYEYLARPAGPPVDVLGGGRQSHDDGDAPRAASTRGQGGGSGPHRPGAARPGHPGPRTARADRRSAGPADRTPGGGDLRSSPTTAVGPTQRSWPSGATASPS